MQLTDAYWNLNSYSYEQIMQETSMLIDKKTGQEFKKSQSDMDDKKNENLS